jgi:hypothetical protein
MTSSETRPQLRGSRYDAGFENLIDSLLAGRPASELLQSAVRAVQKVVQSRRPMTMGEAPLWEIRIARPQDRMRWRSRRYAPGTGSPFSVRRCTPPWSPFRAAMNLNAKSLNW